VADKLYAGHDLLLLSELSGRSGEEGEAPLIARQALHAHRLKIRHPMTDAIMEFVAPIPDDMQGTLDALHTYRKLD
jgi:23S rRNA pseudouridine1911/1915/1917 synthase